MAVFSLEHKQALCAVFAVNWCQLVIRMSACKLGPAAFLLLIGLPFVTGVPDQSWDESAPAGAGFGQDAPAAPAADEWGAAPAAGAAGQPTCCLVSPALTCIGACTYTCHIWA